MNNKASIGKRCRHCQIVRRSNKQGDRRLFVICKQDPKHKSRQS